MWSIVWRCLPLLLLTSYAWSYDDDDDIWASFNSDDASNYAEFITTETERGLFPSIFNLATNSLITATATCGQHQSEEYCKLVEHVLLRKTSNSLSPQCDICDANNVHKRHPIEYAIDGTRRWWQSPSLANGLDYEKVNITIDLRQEYQVAYIIVKMGNSPRPGTWVLEKSIDGVDYSPWMYFANQDADCMRRFGIPATTGVPRFTADDEVHCTSEYSKITPLENGEIHTSLVNGRPGAEKPSIELQKFTRARFVRLRLISPRTLNADLMIINRKSLDRSVTMRYFYSISDISIGGQCICYGHAESCPSDPVTGQFKCECRHNTCGESCNKCCPMFNQLPWKPGTNAQPNVCQPCQCFNHATECVYDEEVEQSGLSMTPDGVYEGGGRCIECQHNTTGINCERCADGFFRPSGMSHYRSDACRECDCDANGSVTQSCVRDDQEAARLGRQPGDCICRVGFGGRRCDRCARGYRNYPTCEPCPCNQAGSINYDTCDDGECRCKPNVEGLYCDRCKAGTIHLRADNPLGCQQCFCFGVSSECGEANVTSAQLMPEGQWFLTDLAGEKNVSIETSSALIYNTAQNADKSIYYWKSPYNGNLLSSYGAYLHYHVYHVPSASEADSPVTPIADVVIEGNGIRVEYFSHKEFHARENVTVTVALRETNGWYNQRLPVDKADLMRALAKVDKFLIRANYRQNQVQSSVFGVMIDGETSAGEQCVCPPTFGGSSCESCDVGYRRVNDQLYGGRCVKCECNGHSDRCDPFTGECLDCQHNTKGARCEMCTDGFYGNPSLGGEEGMCRPCACPSVDNNHSPECMLTQLVSASDSEPQGYICTACDEGYIGNLCDTCDDGFFGNAINGTCERCDCSDNVDPMAIGNCDASTGECRRCINHTTGPKCDKCKPNHYGNAQMHTCTPCECHPRGSKDQQCHEVSGECECNENYTGAKCDRCIDEHGDIDNGCPACECSSIGSIGTECDAISGQCTCKHGVFGKQCDQCLPSYFNLTDAGCQFCHCNIDGSVEGVEESGARQCDAVTGKCVCRPNVDGQMCERCADGFFNITSGEGCMECGCDPTGSLGIDCDLITGQCRCKPGVGGLKCDECLANHYGLGEKGCTECEPCPAPGQVCDPVDGTCVCPPNTVGEMCENCTQVAWDYHPLNGCKLCECSEIGSASGQCNPISGQCECKEGYVGRKCDRCTHGFFNFPNCEPCACNVNGTDPLECNNGVCLCNDLGECPCKKNVVGTKCDQCAEKTFSLDASNPKGCTECFCFNRTSECEQSKLIWQQIYAIDRRAVFQEPWEFYTKKHNINVLKAHSSQFNSYPTDATPLYWPLPESMLGDRTSSYNGFLRFKIWNEDNRRGVHGIRPDPPLFRRHPLVIVVGNDRVELEHIPDMIDEDGTYRVRLHESVWRARNSPDVKLSRKRMMVALQRVHAIYVRATFNYPARGDAINIQDVSLDVGAEPTVGVNSSTAIGVEKCYNCAQGYSGLSCQNPDEGYYRKKNRNYLNEADPLALVGWSEPCQCNGHSNQCHPETGVCIDCQHNTRGEHCDRCDEGYIGDARDVGDAEHACVKCACPHINNTFSDRCAPVNYGRGYVCTACKPGYTGQYCESCIAGFFGDPTHVGGFCESCGCHPDGSLHGACHPLTGQCECKPGVTGRDCSRCQERHAFINRVCTSCDQGCYLPLMTTLDDLEEYLALQNFTGLKPIPWKRLWRIGNETNDVKSFVNSLDADNELIEESKWTRDASSVIDEIEFQTGRVNKSSKSIIDFTNLAEKLISGAQLDYANAFNITVFLRQFAEHGVGTSVGGAALDAMLMEAEAHLDATTERGDYIDKRQLRVEKANESANELLKDVLGKKLNETIFESLKSRIEVFDEWLNDFRSTIYESAKRDTSDAERLSVVVSKRVDRYSQVAQEIDESRAEAEESLAAARDAIERATADELMNMLDDRSFINETLAEQLPSLIEQCSNITLGYAQLIDEYDAEYAVPAGKHSIELEKQAQQIVASFAETRLEADEPLKASSAYEDIVEAMRNATKAAEEAKKASDSAFEALGASDGSDDQLLRKLAKISNQSEAIAQDVQLTLGNWEDQQFEKMNKEMNEKLDKIKMHKESMAKRLAAIKHEAASWDDKHDRMHSVLTNGARTAHERATNAKKEADSLSSQVAIIGEDVEKLANTTSSLVRAQIDKIREARMRLESAHATLAKVGESTKDSQRRVNRITQTIAMLRDRIEQAREKSHQTRLSVSSAGGDDCRRVYVSPARPSPRNRIRIVYRPLITVEDATLFVTRTPQRRTRDSEFVAVEVRDKRVVAHWNVGSGAKMATNNHAVNYIPLNDRSTWYQIDVERVGNSMNLTVSLMQIAAGGSHPRQPSVSVIVDGGSNDESTVFDTIPGETTIKIGADDGDKEAIGLRTTAFRGVIGEIRMDDSLIPLWSASEATSSCDGDAAPASQESALYAQHFRDGFANVSLPLSAAEERTTSAITITFATHSSNGLLYLRGSERHGDHVAIYLKDGHVVFSINLGDSASSGRIESANAYNDGAVHTLKAIRIGSELHLQVDSNSDRYQSVLDGKESRAVFNVDNDQHYVAGVPSTLRRDSFDENIEFAGFVGCVFMVKPSQIGELDLARPDASQRRESGCKLDEQSSRLEPFDRVIGFRGNGYFVTQGQDITNSSTFSFTFSTRDENATLVYQTASNSDAAKGYMAFYLYRGFLVMHFGKDATSRRGVVTFRSSREYNDGQTHAVVMSRRGSTIRVLVDDQDIGETQTLEDQSLIGAGKLMLGGFGADFKPPNVEVPLTDSLLGCVGDIMFNNQPIALIPIEHNALIGICPKQNENNMNNDVELSANDIPQSFRHLSTLHLDPPLIDEDDNRNTIKRSAQLGCLMDSQLNTRLPLRYGATKSSHSRLDFVKPYPNISRFDLSVTIRSVKSNGMLWMWANYKNFTRYVQLNMIDGFATIEVKGHKQPKILKHLGRRVNDGEWHTIHVKKNYKHLQLAIDELDPVEMTDCPSPKVTRRRIYIGGLISKHRRRIETNQYDGCIREIHFNQVLRYVNSTRDVVMCNKGPSSANSDTIYVHQGGYASIHPPANKQKTLDLMFEFRPIVNKGLLLSTPFNYSIEMNGMDLVQNTNGRSSIIDTQKKLCDGKWHTMRIVLNPNYQSIHLDSSELKIKLGNQLVQKILTKPIIHIGGNSGSLEESTTGCYRLIKINGKLIKFNSERNSSVKLHRALVDACPIV